MKKIPTLFLHDEQNMSRLTREVNPACRWVSDGEGIATRKYDGTCFALDTEGWWARREVKPGKTPPPHFVAVETDTTTGKTVGWEPADQSGYHRWFSEAFQCDPRHEGIRGGFPHGTYELIGPKVSGNPEDVANHQLKLHADAERLVTPRDFDGLAAWLAGSDFEGIVWHHPDGRMAKIKRRDFEAGSYRFDVTPAASSPVDAAGSAAPSLDTG